MTSPIGVLALAVVAVSILLSLPLSLPVGPMYWDVFIYYDAANRILSGQVPVRDFFTPVGPLGYYLFTGWLMLFPNGQPAILAHWSLLAVTAPVMALILHDVSSRSRTIAFALLVPFLLFALLPFNTRDFYPFPGSEGFGIYNRQVCQALYVLVAAILFVRRPRTLIAVIGILMTALFFLKITGFVAGGIIAAFAFLTRRVSLRMTAVIVAVFAAVLAVLELTSGLVGRYVTDILLLIQMNSGTLAPRFLQSASLNFGVLAPAGLLAALLLWADRDRLASSASHAWRERDLAGLAGVVDHNALWLLVVLFAGILFETQNTGSQALIFLWPVVLSILLRVDRLIARPALLVAAVGLAAAISLPPAVTVTESAARAYVGAVKNVPLEHENLKTLGALNMRNEVSTRVAHLLGFYPTHRQLYEDMVAVNELPTPVLYSDFDFQIIHLIATDQAISSIRALEAAKDIRFDTIMSLNFVNPYPWLMDREAPLHVAIGADPFRAVPTPGSEEESAVAATDLVLYPTCPPTTANAELYRMYEAALVGHTRIKLNDCYDAFVNPKFRSLSN